MEFTALQILPPKDWGRFEDMCRGLFAAVWGDPYAQKNGRTGQPQHGVDVWGRAGGPHAGTHCVQCKGKDANYGGTVTIAEFDTELAKAEHFQPEPAYWILATTAPNDGVLQKHARVRSAEREAQGTFPVNVLGWETLVALMGEHPKVIEQFYPEHGSHMQELLAAVRALPRRDELIGRFEQFAVAANPTSTDANGIWQPVRFDQARGLGPALLGRALGAADAMECPRLPEAADLIRELTASYSARLAGVPGAGKSVCALQAAETLAGKGYRVLRLADSGIARIELTDDDLPTVHLIDDAHLASTHELALAEQSARATKLLLSTFTSVDGAGTRPGTIHLDAKRAVRVIADELRARRDETLAAVRTIDDRIGDGLGEESIDWRLDAAAQSDFPWQFCFVLSGGWHRVRSIVASARAADADIVLGAVAIRQLASRDARANASDLAPLLAAAQVAPEAAERAIAWLLEQRLVLAANDLRCPHQRFSAEVFDPILTDQDKDGRQQVVAMMGHALADPKMPLAGLASLLTQFRMSRRDIIWTPLIRRDLLEPFLDRCWSAQSPTDIAAAAYALREIDIYIDDYFERPTKAQVETVARWFSTPMPEAAYRVGAYINGTYRNRRFGRSIIRASNPEAIAEALNQAMEPASADFACEIAKMVSQSFSALTPEWIARYLARVDRAKALALVADWPASSPLYHAGWFCAQFTYLDREFGFDCVETLAPAIAERMRADPIGAFGQLEDVFEASLRVFDPLGAYKGKWAPTARSRAIASQLCSAWEPKALAGELSRVTARRFQSAAGLLNVLRKSLPGAYEETVSALDWDAIEAAVGDGWAKLPHNADHFLAQCHASRAGRKEVARLIEKHIEEIDKLDARFAFMAPKAAFRQIERGARIVLSGRWQLGAGVLAEFYRRRPELVQALLGNHPALLAAALSKESPSFFDDALPFLRVCRQVAPEAFENILGQIDPEIAEKGWRNALLGRNGKHKARNASGRSAIAWLVHVTQDRPDPLGDLARRLLAELPKETKISPKKLEPFSDL
ncbi:hypothetical protein [Pelagerythrobacter rhizovicinus]|uniref:Restriction endonuclease type IV Mrr domain-containing protein n=1 Tax=Pelagerythrobacter rhizovicinus TaxID=2268576 RepID=A0A4Q2KLL7_9SPHN|nr:hypothetical protein [Pelagerythrobacter rhizovicinus]RXZ64243.1 hypothetical protein ETX26_10040 [Pelagerythrobacter rhizovicinus]